MEYIFMLLGSGLEWIHWLLIKRKNKSWYPEEKWKKRKLLWPKMEIETVDFLNAGLVISGTFFFVIIQNKPLYGNLTRRNNRTLHIFNDTQRYFVQLFKEPSLLFEEWSWDSPCTVDESFSEHQLIHIGGGFNNPGWVSLSTILLWERQHALAAHWRSSLKGAVRCTTHWNRPQTLIHTVTSSNVLF